MPLSRAISTMFCWWTPKLASAPQACSCTPACSECFCMDPMIIRFPPARPQRYWLQAPSCMAGCIGKAHFIWVCLKIGYTPNYSHLIGIMISKTIGFRGTQHFQTNPYHKWLVDIGCVLQVSLRCPLRCPSLNAGAPMATLLVSSWAKFDKAKQAKCCTRASSFHAFMACITLGRYDLHLFQDLKIGDWRSMLRNVRRENGDEPIDLWI